MVKEKSVQANPNSDNLKLKELSVNDQQSIYVSAVMMKPKQDKPFELEQLDGVPAPQFDLESPETSEDLSINQAELYLPERNPDLPRDEQQIEIESLSPVIHAVQIEGEEKAYQFHRAPSLLDSLEYQGLDIAYQCREGYCGACRTDIVEGEVAYLKEPMAWVNEGEILPCCCVPKSAVKLKLKG